MPIPAWVPDDDAVARANVTSFARDQGLSGYPALWRWSVDHRSAFWQAVIDRLGVVFRRPPVRVLDLSERVEHARWLPGAELNIVDSCFQGDPDAVAVIHERDGALHEMTYGELEVLVSRAAEAFQPDEAVAIVMPMTLKSVVAYLGIVKAGGVVVSIPDSFSAPEIAARLEIASAATAVTQDVVVRSGRRFAMAEKVRTADARRRIVVRTDDSSPLLDGEVSWSELTAGRGVSADSHVGPAERHTNVLFSSGTTGAPKAIPWTHLTPLKAAMDGHFHQDLHPEDVVCWPTNLGWMMGPWLIYASLINGAAMALFDDAPTGRAFGEFVRDAGVSMLGVVPSLVATWRSTGCMEGLDWSGIRCFSSTGEASNEADMRYLMELAGGRPVIEYCGGTEIGGGYLTGTVVQPSVPAAFSTPALGLDVEILDDGGRPAEEGELFLVPPSIGLSGELLNADHDSVYYEGTPRAGLRRHGDRFARLEGGYFRAMGRADDTMNLGGIKVSSAELERVVADVTGVREAAAVGVPPPGGGPDRLVVFAAPEPGVPADPKRWMEEIQGEIRRRLNPLFKVSEVVTLDALPRTASNKVMRRVLRRRLIEGDVGRAGGGAGDSQDRAR
jgi:acetyl-CoA synthetase